MVSAGTCQAIAAGCLTRMCANLLGSPNLTVFIIPCCPQINHLKQAFGEYSALTSPNRCVFVLNSPNVVFPVAYSGVCICLILFPYDSHPLGTPLCGRALGGAWTVS